MLRQVARHFSDRDLSNYCFVFPNRRAGLFFLKYMEEEAKKTTIEPEVMTIAEFFQSYSTTVNCDQPTLLFELYNVYSDVLTKNGKSVEPFDEFVPFGQTLISDFNDVDNYMVNAGQLYTNIDDLQKLSGTEYINDKQKEALETFFKHTIISKDSKSSHIDTFKSIWSMLFDIYTDFRKSLKNKQLSYPGMQCRDVVERSEHLDTSYKKVIFVGFNALNEVERKLFKALGEKADFYWDYDLPYVNDNTNIAHYFADKNRLMFPSKEALEVETITQETEFYSITAPSMTEQTIEARKILDTLNANNTNTAIVLLDEQLLLPMLFALPLTADNNLKVNVTMGFPISHTPILKFIEEFILLQNSCKTTKYGIKFYPKYEKAILSHPYVSGSDKIKGMVLNKYNDSALLDTIISIFSSIEAQNDYDVECLSQARLYLNNINRLLKAYNQNIAPVTLLQILRQILSSISVAFKGEPIKGLQIMGTLETRCLSFENIIFISFNEGIFPKNDNQNSYIPYNIRRGFNLPTTEHQDAVFAYNFYRLIARAKRVYMISDCRTDGLKNGEPSRYLKHLEYIYGKKINKIASSGNIKTEPMQTQMQKPEDWGNVVLNRRAMSASAVNEYLRCQYRFHIDRYLDVKQPSEESEIMEANDIGTIFHKSIQILYSDLKAELHNKPFTKEALNNLKNNQLKIDKAIIKAFSQEYFKNIKPEDITLEGFNKLVYTLVKKYIKSTISYDSTQAPFVLEACECRYNATVSYKNIKFTGSIDRIDSFLKDGVTHYRLIDYKTGSGKVLKDKDPMDKNNGVLRQMLLYQYFFEKEHNNKIHLNVYELSKLGIKYSSPEIFIPGDEELAKNQYISFIDGLNNLLQTIADPTIPITKTNDANICATCPYSELCSRL
ncbi:MAG: PD-(D/E)XK nuclease family protein [Paludibacteraceae bacterium]|nr:PD-(D/E)XK nuclease family protein [Paludibacteraceae bacterium]